MSSNTVLRALLRRASVVRLVGRQDAELATASLVELCAFYNQYQDALAELAPPLQRLSRQHGRHVASVGSTIAINTQSPLDGRRLALLVKYVPASQSSSPDSSEGASLRACWTHIGTLLSDAVRVGVWPAHDLHALTSQFLKRGSFFTAEEVTNAVQQGAVAYLRTHAAIVGDAETLAVLTTMAVTLQLSGGGVGPDVSLAPVHHTLAQRTVALHALSPIRAGVLGHLCAQWNRLPLVHPPLAQMVASQAVRLAEEADLFAVLQCFLFLWRHPPITNDCAALPSLLERLCSEPLDAQAWTDLSRAVADPACLPLRATDLTTAERVDVVVFLCSQLVELLAVKVSDGGLAGCAPDHLQTITARLLALRRLLVPAGPHPPPAPNAETSVDDPQPVSTATTPSSSAPLPEAFVDAVTACTARITTVAEDLMADESPPFALMSSLADTPCESAQTCCLALLHEAALQYVHLPTAQSFQFLLVMGDKGCDDAVVSAYLADAFVKTAAAVPPIQLVAALRAFMACVPGEGSSPATCTPQIALVNRFCAEKVCAFLSDSTMPLHALVVAVAALHRLGYREDVFYAACATFMRTKAALVLPSQLCRRAATAACEALGEDLLDTHSGVHELLLEAAANGLADDWPLTPSAWMHRHDPANTLLPLTAPQRRCRQLVETMANTPAHDHQTLVSLATQYVESLADAHPDEHRRFFAVCEDKVLKEDAVLLKCVEALATDPLLLARLSESSLAALLHSLAAVRFTYTRAVKRLLLCVTAEQWVSMSAAALVDVLTGMASLSAAVPAVQSTIGERLIERAPLLTPVQTALAIRSFQSLGGGTAESRRAVLSVLLEHAAKNARRFDEMALSVLFSTPSVHRLLHTPSVALPLVHQAALEMTSTPQRQRLAASVRRSGLPRDLIAQTTTRLLSPHAPASLRLGQ